MSVISHYTYAESLSTVSQKSEMLSKESIKLPLLNLLGNNNQVMEARNKT